ncbi:MAG: hypothetical protein AAFZ15_32750 [Bacteroidota bacterium]
MKSLSFIINTLFVFLIVLGCPNCDLSEDEAFYRGDNKVCATVSYKNPLTDEVALVTAGTAMIIEGTDSLQLTINGGQLNSSAIFTSGSIDLVISTEIKISETETIRLQGKVADFTPGTSCDQQILIDSIADSNVALFQVVADFENVRQNVFNATVCLFSDLPSLNADDDSCMSAVSKKSNNLGRVAFTNLTIGENYYVKSFVQHGNSLYRYIPDNPPTPIIPANEITPSPPWDELELKKVATDPTFTLKIRVLADSPSGLEPMPSSLVCIYDHLYNMQQMIPTCLESRDSMFANPEGEVEFKGLSAGTYYINAKAFAPNNNSLLDNHSNLDSLQLSGSATREIIVN